MRLISVRDGLHRSMLQLSRSGLRLLEGERSTPSEAGPRTNLSWIRQCVGLGSSKLGDVLVMEVGAVVA